MIFGQAFFKRLVLNPGGAMRIVGRESKWPCSIVVHVFFAVSADFFKVFVVEGNVGKGVLVVFVEADGFVVDGERDGVVVPPVGCFKPVVDVVDGDDFVAPVVGEESAFGFVVGFQAESCA